MVSPVYFIFCYVIEYFGDQNKHDSCPYGSHKQMRKNTNDCKENECYKRGSKCHFKMGMDSIWISPSLQELAKGSCKVGRGAINQKPSSGNAVLTFLGLLILQHWY